MLKTMVGVNAIHEGMGNAHLHAKELPDATCIRGVFPAHETGQHEDKKYYISGEGGEDTDPAVVCMQGCAGASNPG